MKTLTELIKEIGEGRKTLHFIDLADLVIELVVKHTCSERAVAALTNLSKSEVHRCIEIGRLSFELKEAAKKFNTQKYVLLEYKEMSARFSSEAYIQIISGEMRTRNHLRIFRQKRGVIAVPKKVVRTATRKQCIREVKELLKPIRHGNAQKALQLMENLA